MWLFGIFYGNRASWAIAKGYVTLGTVRKVATAMGKLPNNIHYLNENPFILFIMQFY